LYPNDAWSSFSFSELFFSSSLSRKALFSSFDVGVDDDVNDDVKENEEADVRSNITKEHR
jgi:hypothetical protein